MTISEFICLGVVPISLVIFIFYLGFNYSNTSNCEFTNGDILQLKLSEEKVQVIGLNGLCEYRIRLISGESTWVEEFELKEIYTVEEEVS